MTAVAKVNKNIIVVIHNVGPLVLKTIFALSKVVAVVWARIPGKRALTARRRPIRVHITEWQTAFTISKQQSDYGTAIASGDDSYSEGLYIDYRLFHNVCIEPRYEFRLGLSSTTFDYSSLVTGSISSSTGGGANAASGVSSLWDVVATLQRR